VNAVQRTLVMATAAVGAMAAFALLLPEPWVQTLSVSETSAAVVASPTPTVVAERLLRFIDMPDGGIDVMDAQTGQRLDLLHGEQGFVRGTLRGFARERKRNEVPLDTALSLVLHADRRLELRDQSTTHRVDLGAFGPDNAAAFARWLPTKATQNS
jgi:putative photosynthetic complex assembly protein